MSDQKTNDVHAPATLSQGRTRTLKLNDTFAIFDGVGDVHQAGRGELGIYHDGTRFLSESTLSFDDGRRPLLLNSDLEFDAGVLAVRLTNPDLGDGPPDATARAPNGVLYVERRKFLRDGACQERVRVQSFADRPVEFSIDARFGADFADVFEVRGTARARRGAALAPEFDARSVTLRYRGLDDVLRQTRIGFSGTPERVDADGARYRLRLEPRQELALEFSFEFCIGPVDPATPRPSLSFEAGLEELRRSQEARRRGFPTLVSDSPAFDQWLDRSTSDLSLLTTETPLGLYPFAGVPWYSTYFGRDAIVAAMQCLWLNPELAKGVLRTLASTQARGVDAVSEAEPGKIIHEMRRGEMAALGEVPFGKYYGSVDSTPLFLALAAAYADRTADVATIREIWPQLTAALAWLETDGDPDGDGFVEYAPKNKKGLSQQGWKDSADSISHASGELAAPSIALCEVQGYAYMAFAGLAKLAPRMGEPALGARLAARAVALKARFNELFWNDELGLYALALDGEKKPCLVRSSNAGHCLFSGIATPERARRTAQTLLSPALFSGWGIRTLAATEVRYNPLSYHNGSIWPHDNSLIALGFARYGLQAELRALFAAFFDVSAEFDLRRLPELFCGFERRPNEMPVLYPVACAPQAWASAAVFLFLQALLGLEIDAERGLVTLSAPDLPASIGSLLIRGLRVGEASLDLRVRREGDVTQARAENVTGPVRVQVERLGLS